MPKIFLWFQMCDGFNVVIGRLKLHPASNEFRQTSLAAAIAIQGRVIRALIMRELHTRYGRENIGYLWLIVEPLMLGAVISVLHNKGGSGGGMNPAVFAMVGYTVFILFRSMINRAEGAIDANASLLYHRMVTVLDICLSRAFLELAGTITAFIILYGGCYALGYIDIPERPLLLIAGIGAVFCLSLGVSMIITGGTYHNRLLERFVHPFAYFQIPLSAAFFQVKDIPEPYRTYLMYSPLPQAFELVRYGVFQEANADYINPPYIVAWCLVLIVSGLISIKSLKFRIKIN